MVERILPIFLLNTISVFLYSTTCHVILHHERLFVRRWPNFSSLYLFIYNIFRRARPSGYGGFNFIQIGVCISSKLNLLCHVFVIRVHSFALIHFYFITSFCLIQVLRHRWRQKWTHPCTFFIANTCLLLLHGPSSRIGYYNGVLALTCVFEELFNWK